MVFLSLAYRMWSVQTCSQVVAPGIHVNMRAGWREGGEERSSCALCWPPAGARRATGSGWSHGGEVFVTFCEMGLSRQKCLFIFLLMCEKSEDLRGYFLCNCHLWMWVGFFYKFTTTNVYELPFSFYFRYMWVYVFYFLNQIVGYYLYLGSVKTDKFKHPKLHLSFFVLDKSLYIYQLNVSCNYFVLIISSLKKIICQVQSGKSHVTL